MDEEQAGGAEQEEIIQQLLQEKEQDQGKMNQMANDMANFQTAQRGEGNIATYIIDTNELLEKLERFYKGEYISFDDEGNQIWKKPENTDQIPLNAFGVSAMMEIVSKYIDKNTSLSWYKEERIYEILADLGDELITFLLSNYEQMGMDTYFKKTKFRILIVTTLHMVESTYRRSLGGKTLEEINQSRIISQSDLLGRGGQMQPQMMPKSKSKIFPWG